MANESIKKAFERMWENTTAYTGKLETNVNEKIDNLSEDIVDLSLNTVSLVDGENIPSNSDLNTVVEVGNYKCTNQNDVKTLINCPTKNSFKMTVLNTSLFYGGEYRTQEIQDMYGKKFHRYTWNNGVDWTEWEQRDIGLNTSVDIGYKEYTQSTGRFADEMNRTAMYLGMTKSIFNTACGFNDFTTAHDLLRLLIGAKHTPTAISVMGTNECRTQVNNKGLVVKHSMLETANWKNWADENGYTMIATKGGSVKGTSANGYWDGQVGIMNNAMLLQDTNGDLYGLSIVGLQNPSDWNETKSYMKYERVKVDNVTYMSLTDNNLNNVVSDATYWIETVGETDMMRTLMHDLIECLNGADESDVIHDCANAINREYPVGMGAVKLTSNGTLAEDMDCLSSGIFYNENEIRFAASATKIMTAIVVSSQLDNHLCSVVSDDIIGGSGHDFVVGDVISTNDAFYMMMLLSDNTMANMLARDCGKRMTGAVVSLSNGFSIPSNSDLNTFTIVGNYKQTNSKNVATFTNCPTTEPFSMVVGYSCLMNTGSHKFQEITTLKGLKYFRYTWNDGTNWTGWKERGFNADLESRIKALETKIAELEAKS